jgi:hypothetical protein
MSKLNVGCGFDIREGWVNLDSNGLPGVDIVHDIETLPLPFSDDTFEYVLCQDVLEHVEYIPLLRDIWRIMRRGATLHIRVPHFTSANAYGDPTHRKLFNVETFEFFTKDHRRSYYFDFSFSKRENLYIHFGPRLFRPFSRFINQSRRMQRLYEASPLRVIPATNVELDLIK